jgi:hypothetical protein
VALDPHSLAHFPDVSGHIITSIRTETQVESGNVRHPIDSQLGGVAIPGIKIIPPGPPPAINSPGCFFPLSFRRKLLSSPVRISPGVVPTQTYHWLEGLVPSFFSPEHGGPMIRILEELAVLVIGYGMKVDVIIFQHYFSAWRLGGKNRVLGAV